MKTHVTLELAKWLHDRGCDLDSQESHLVRVCIKACRSDGHEGCLGQQIGKYTYYDILVTHAKEFWGPFSNDVLTHLSWVLYLLQQGRTEEVEDYIMKHSLFSKNKV